MITVKLFPWLVRFPVGLFAIPVGLLGLAGAWRRAQGFGWPMVMPVSQTIAWTAVALLIVLLLLYAAKCLHYPRTLATELPIR